MPCFQIAVLRNLIERLFNEYILTGLSLCAVLLLPTLLSAQDLSTPGIGAVSCASSEPSANGDFDPTEATVGMLDLRDPSGTEYSDVWGTGNQNNTPAIYQVGRHPKMSTMWTGHELGQIFGLAKGKPGSADLFAAVTAIYGNKDSNNGPVLNGMWASDPMNTGNFRLDPMGRELTGAVWHLNTANANYNLLFNVDTTGSTALRGAGLGQIAYNADHDLLYFSNFHDGQIYTITSTGMSATPLGTYDHEVQLTGTNSGTTVLVDVEIAKLGRRIWAVQYNPVDQRVYYGVWRSDFQNQTGDTNQIWSVATDGAGMIVPTSQRLEVDIPFLGNLQASAPVSDIEFSLDGRLMFLAERGTAIGQRFEPGFGDPHSARVLAYENLGNGWAFASVGPGFGSGGLVIGPHSKETNSSGGVALAHRYHLDSGGTRPQLLDPSKRDGYLWASVNGWGYNHNTKDGKGIDATYGAQGTDLYHPSLMANSGGDDWTAGSNATFPFLLVDYDDNRMNNVKSQIGDIEIRQAGAGCFDGSSSSLCTGDNNGNDVHDITLTIDPAQMGGPLSVFDTLSVTPIQPNTGTITLPGGTPTFSPLPVWFGNSATTTFTAEVPAGATQVCFSVEAVNTAQNPQQSTPDGCCTETVCVPLNPCPEGCVELNQVQNDPNSGVFSAQMCTTLPNVTASDILARLNGNLLSNVTVTPVPGTTDCFTVSGTAPQSGTVVISVSTLSDSATGESRCCEGEIKVVAPPPPVCKPELLIEKSFWGNLKGDILPYCDVEDPDMTCGFSVRIWNNTPDCPFEGKLVLDDNFEQPGSTNATLTMVPNPLFNCSLQGSSTQLNYNCLGSFSAAQGTALGQTQIDFIFTKPDPDSIEEIKNCAKFGGEDVNGNQVGGIESCAKAVGP